MPTRAGVTSVLSFLVILIWGCNVDPINDPIIVSSIDQEFAFSLWEDLNASSDSPLQIRIHTIEDEECLNTSILTSYERSNRELKLTLFDILDPENCDPGQAPAKGEEAIDDIGFGLYDLKIELQGIVTNHGELSSTSLSYQVNMDEQNGIQWMQNELFRVPNAALWGYLTYTDVQGEDRANDFLNELKEITTELETEDGYYGHFELSNAGSDLKVYEMPEDGEVMPFLLRFYGELSEIDELVSELHLTAPEGVELVLRDQHGNEWQ